MITKTARIGITEQQTVRPFMLDVMIGKAEPNQQQELKRQNQKEKNLTVFLLILRNFSEL